MLGMLYVQEKLRELETERALVRSRMPRPPRVPRRPGPRTPLLAPLARRAGRALRRLGAGLEAWGAASSRSAG
jgi:hypothetical protein